jgi:uncharacterized membrane protein YphA (DoxX/SURF4 family)
MINSFKSQSISMRILRIWLGVTWIYAGWVKASDAGFLKQGSPTYIGTQLAAYASQSPIGSILNHFVEHALIVGIFVILSEFAIGIATLTYVAPSMAAFGGLTMSIGLWLSSSFHSSPYFLASDTAYAVLWAAYFFSITKTNSRKRGKVDVNLDRRGVMRGAAVAAGAILALTVAGLVKLADFFFGLFVFGIVTNAGVAFEAATFAGGTSTSAFNYHDSGTGTNAAAVTDTALQTPTALARVAGTQTTPGSTNVYQTVATLSYNNTFAITEWGLFSALSGGTLWDRRVIGTITTAPGDEIEWTYTCMFAPGGI